MAVQLSIFMASHIYKSHSNMLDNIHHTAVKGTGKGMEEARRRGMVNRGGDEEKRVDEKQTEQAEEG